VSAKLLLAVVDGLKPAMLERAVATGRAPAMAAVMERGTYVDECVAAFPSVTPACAATIATGVRQEAHHIPSMNWYSRDEGRYVEYGSSFSASRRFGLVQQLTDTIYNMNATHLPREVLTVFESLDDLGVRTAGTTYLMYRGRYEHQTSKNTALTRLASTVFRRPVMGPRELFYADIFASRETPCRSQLGLPGIRDQHAGCVGAYLVEEDLFDFLLLSLPDNDTHSHRHGPHAQVTSIAAADRQLERLFHAGGGTEKFLDEHAVIVVADHSHAPVEKAIDLQAAYAELNVLAPSGARRRDAEIAVCPAQRSAMIYALLPEGRDALLPRIIELALEIDGVDLALWRPAPREGAIANQTGEVRFAPGGDVRDERGGRWSIDGPLEVLDARLEDGVLRSHAYPDALGRAWSALTCPTSGDVLLSASPGYEFADWGGVDHVGGGSHGSLHRVDSLGALTFCGVPAPHDHGSWSIADVAPMVRGHFGA
jgi:Type I phosphodiesterase / nucleotide pyrophosphatase